MTVIGIFIYKSYYVSEQKTKNINVYNLFKHKYNTRIKDKMSLLWNIIYIWQAYKYGGVKFINGIPTLLSSVLNVRGLKIEILHVELFCFVISSVFYIKGGG